MHAPNEIRHKKPAYPIGERLAEFLRAIHRAQPLPLSYGDLLRHDGLMAQQDAHGRETLWTTVMLRPGEIEDIHERLVHLYQLIVADGRMVEHLRVASIDFCAYGNSQPFRIKILNQINDNHDYYYIKKTDASRVYGLELEHMLSPNRINYLVDGDTLVEEHIIGVPGDDFIRAPGDYGGHLNPVRLSKEFVKFNERCFARLLGDMRAYNFVVDVIQDFDQVQYRLRSIDFDQQCHEGRHKIYLPQFYKENLPFVQFSRKYIDRESAVQYSNEERSLLRKRYRLSQAPLEELLGAMCTDPISTAAQVHQLARELADLHNERTLARCTSMGELLGMHLKLRLGVD
ncbi:MAG: hypothetical protein KBH07_11780 [Flavobacteriales bacterium]|nr:hypothetical protein [Flavobacteriales bacterium]MBP9080036.1 hypothetical protein [Flavobacteriales bacterium]